MMKHQVTPSGKLRMALIGGGGHAFIGPVHARAATMDGEAELVAGVLSSNPRRARAAAADFGIAEDRAYGSMAELIERESQLPDDRRIHFVSIATPNHTHFELARAAIEAGFHVICDKPMTIDVPQAEQLVQLVKQRRVIFALAHNYTGYPQVRQVRALVRDGRLGQIQAVRTQYIQGGLWGHVPGQTPVRGAWKADPEKAGPSGTLSDIGTHAYNLLRYTTGLVAEQVACTLKTFHTARPLDDYGHVVLRLAGGALGTITVSQVSHGRLNDLTLEIDGTDGSLIWRQEEPERILLRRHGEPLQVYERNPKADDLDAVARSCCRLPAGHPEGFLEAFANLYRDAFFDMRRHAAGETIRADETIYPNVNDGLDGVRFVACCIASSRDGGSWQNLTP